ncbi:MAG: AzlD domain-containing protein [Actinomycetota bacterium]|nr:AzlD domain-containing protein [Actinomycetota bacterium]
MTDFIAIAVVGLGTYLGRSVFILALANRRIPDTVMVALQFVAPAVLAALIVALLTDGDGNVGIGAPEVAAFVVGGGVAAKTRNHVYTLFAGMAVYWIVRAVF